VPDSRLALDRTPPASPERRLVVLAVVGLAGGIAIALIDSSPGWDDSGVTAGLLLAGAALLAALDGRRPWLWAGLVGLPLPLVEIARTGTAVAIAAVLFAVVGALLGYVARLSLRSRPG
jgi:hypothetical protein